MKNRKSRLNWMVATMTALYLVTIVAACVVGTVANLTIIFAR